LRGVRGGGSEGTGGIKYSGIGGALGASFAQDYDERTAGRRHMTGFSTTKKAVGAYFNDGVVICSCQVQKIHQGNPSPILIDATRLARDLFFAVINKKDIAAIREELTKIYAEPAAPPTAAPPVES
jgi:hypothetical protein